ncbi:MAG: hypothetical protein ASARMPREDX12_008195 [Alectoria sarmentosa]|nr:MAG: hypothetical protein ASARMPREDX12_008195 [Alectoria sarmentosa]
MKLRSGNQAAAEKTKSTRKKPLLSLKMMKLRSGTNAAAILNNPIPQTLLATKNLTLTNVSSPLLKLPPEVRNRIYYFVNGGNFIHVEGIPERNSFFRIVLCRATMSEEDAHRAFETASASDESLCDAANRHSCCFEGLGTTSEFDTSECPPGATKVSVSLLRTCRQIYQEAKYILYSTNIFSFRQPTIVSWFCSRLKKDLSGHERAIRNIHFDMAIDRRADEARWNEAIRALGGRLHGVQQVQISIHQATIRRTFAQTRRVRSRNPTQGKNTFLAEISSLRRLSLGTLRISVFDSDRLAWFSAQESEYEWTHGQKQEWARNTEKVILSSG